jgi:hypothetical protein
VIRFIGILFKKIWSLDCNSVNTISKNNKKWSAFFGCLPNTEQFCTLQSTFLF